VQRRFRLTDPAACRRRREPKSRSARRDTLEWNGASDDDIDFLAPASDDLARVAAGNWPRRGAAPVRTLLNDNPALSWDTAPDHRLTIAGSSPTGIVPPD